MRQLTGYIKQPCEPQLRVDLLLDDHGSAAARLLFPTLAGEVRATGRLRHATSRAASCDSQARIPDRAAVHPPARPESGPPSSFAFKFGFAASQSITIGVSQTLCRFVARPRRQTRDAVAPPVAPIAGVQGLMHVGHEMHKKFQVSAFVPGRGYHWPTDSRAISSESCP